MPINATISRPRGIVANTTSLITSQTNPPLDLKNNGASLTQNYVHNLFDVVENNPQDGNTLVYNANTHKYEVKSISLSVASIDGGTF
jgi:hypothetical protein